MHIRNFRDISGDTNKNGKTMKSNMIFQSGALDHLTRRNKARGKRIDTFYGF